jgi:uncharacterized protein
MIEMEVESVRISTRNDQHVIILKEKLGERCLPIWIGPAEADAIATKIQGVTRSRPMTHDLMYSIISALTASVDLVLLNELKGDTFYARITLNIGGKGKEIDCRPSDAVALALRAEVPIFAEEGVLKEGGIIFDKNSGEPVTKAQDGEETTRKKITQEELKKLSAFRDFIDKADLNNLDKNES